MVPFALLAFYVYLGKFVTSLPAGLAAAALLPRGYDNEVSLLDPWVCW